VAKVALIQRELKREKLAAKFAKKYAELKGIADDAKRSEEERMAARAALQIGPATPTQLASATAARSRVVRVAHSVSSAWDAPRSVSWPLRATSRA